MRIFDVIVECGLSIHDYALKNGLESVIRYYDKKGEKTQFSSYDPDNLSSLIGDMPRIYTEQKKTRAGDLLMEEGNSIYAKGNLAFVTADLNQELMESLISIKNRKKNPLLFAVIPKVLDEEEWERRKRPLAALEDAGVPYYVLDSAEDLMRQT